MTLTIVLWLLALALLDAAIALLVIRAFCSIKPTRHGPEPKASNSPFSHEVER